MAPTCDNFWNMTDIKAALVGKYPQFVDVENGKFNIQRAIQENAFILNREFILDKNYTAILEINTIHGSYGIDHFGLIQLNVTCRACKQTKAYWTEGNYSY